MNCEGGVIQAAATGCAAVNEEDKSRPWREYVQVESDEKGTYFTGSDGRMVVQVSCCVESDVHGLLSLKDAKRIKGSDGVSIEMVKGGQRKTAHLTISESDIEATLIHDDGKGRLQEVYPDGPADLLALFPRGRPIARLDAAMLRRAASAIIRAGGKGCEMHFAKGVAGGVLFFTSTNDEGDTIEVAIGQTETVERKSKTGEIVERTVPLPLFDAAKEPEGVADESSAAAEPDEE